MMREEFEELTGIFPSNELYAQIETAYMDYKDDKTAFCDAYVQNLNGLAEKIQMAANQASVKKHDEQEAIIKDSAMRISMLEKALENELEWKSTEIEGNVSQNDYNALAQAAGTRKLSDEEAKEMLYNQYGFAKEKITILHTVPKYEVNRHRKLRKVGEFDRVPLYNSTDWNYIRFDCGCMTYELFNDSLCLFVS